MSNNNLAINICLLFNKEELYELYQFNEYIWSKEKVGYLYDHSHQPHLTLFQKFIQEKDIESSIEITKRFVNHNQIFPCFYGYSYTAHVQYLQSYKVAALELEDRNGLLSQYNHYFLSALTKLQNVQGSSQSFVINEGNSESIQWVNNYESKSLAGKYSPHITIGFCSDSVFSDYPHPSPKITLHPTHLVLARMGNLCSINSNIIYKYEIPKSKH
ncbi:MAG: hypothetical protein KDD50_00305 [Bdellovibrionales bacterium]|nr:hypothetical protein [Bdellovibrionales bacterium]MCB0412741.1 hypothetical protein [Bdellovibrionales bacterium]